ncbi:MAG TPA: SIMPL domain-containing protein [Micropepsaceae bacterium]|nr:SIMPL domain-containing protein [Micropepsaceae bacterium]
MTRFRAISTALLMIAALPVPALAADNAPQRTIIVTGEGEVLGKPDQARIAAAVVNQAPTAEAAAQENATAMNRVLMAITALGIPPNKIQTSNYSVQPQYASVNVSTNRNITGYQVTNELTITVDDLSKLGTISDTLVHNGANQLGGVAFTIADPKPLADRARTAAVTDARAKAQTLANAGGVRLGPLLNIQEGPGVFRPTPFAAPRALEAASTPIAVGEQPIIVAVTLTYAIQ